MAGSQPETTYELQIKQRDRWEIHARYPADRQASAIRDAKSLEKISTISAVKVIKEEYDPSSGIGNETIIFSGPTPKGQGPDKAKAVEVAKPEPPHKKKAKAKKPDKPAREPSPDGAAKAKKTARQQGPSLSRIFIKLLLVTLFSITIAGFFAGLASVWLRDTTLSNNTQANILFAIFVGAFLISAISMAISFLSGDFKDRTAAQPQPAAPKPEKKPAEHDKAKALAADLRKNLEEEELPLVTASHALLQEALASGVKLKADDYLGEEEAKPAGLSPQAEKQMAFLMEFLKESLNHAKVTSAKLDNFNKFGIDLFLAGANEVLSRRYNLEGAMVAMILGEAVRVVGFTKNQAEHFADAYNDYLMTDSRYMQMFQAGRTAMNGYTATNRESAKNLKLAFEEWNKPKPKEEKTGPVTVMFTDMVGSTALTQTRGDAVAQKVVHAHNRIVREALIRYHGKEIKHTGDGIMASFAKTSEGVEAAIAIQKQAAGHNLANSELPLHLKIGINAGEPIAEDDDLFGTTVQLAARIVDKAKSEQIFVSETVRGICAGKELKFASRGGHAMKGFEGNLTLYEAVWDDNAPGPGEKPKKEADKKAEDKEAGEETAEAEGEPAEGEAAEEPAEEPQEAGEETADAEIEEAAAEEAPQAAGPPAAAEPEPRQPAAPPSAPPPPADKDQDGTT